MLCLTYQRTGGLFMHLYPVLMDSYMFSDREPEYSIIQLSLQLFAIPNIAVHLITMLNAFPIIICILHSFFTEQIDRTGKHLDLPPNLSITRIMPDSSSFKHKRYVYIFSDLRRLLSSSAGRTALGKTTSNFAFFASFANLFTNMNPIIRAATEHVEFEADTWVTAFNMTMHLAKVCRTVGEVYSAPSTSTAELEKVREAIGVIIGKTKTPAQHLVSFGGREYACVKFLVRDEPVSFHHPLAWLLAEVCKNLPAAIDVFEKPALVHLPSTSALLLVLEDSLRSESEGRSLLRILMISIACVLISQIRSGLWVRNGFSVRAQQTHYREYNLREHTYDQDTYLLQLGLLQDPEHVLVAFLDRFDVVKLLDQPEAMEGVEHYDTQQTQSMLEEVLLLLVYLLTEPANLSAWTIEDRVRRDIVHCLALGSCAHSELIKRVADQSSESIEFDRILKQVSTYRQPQGAFDHGVYSLKPEMLKEIHPYYFRYSRNQRDEVTTLVKESGSFPDMTIWIDATSRLPTGCQSVSALCATFSTSAFSRLLVAVFLLQQARSDISEPLLDAACQLFLLSMRTPDAPPRLSSIDLLRDTSVSQVLQHLRSKVETGHLQLKLDLCIKRWEEQSHQPVADHSPVIKNDFLSAMEATSAPDDMQAKRAAAKARQAAVLAQFAQARKTFVDDNPIDFDDSEDEDMGEESADAAGEVFGDCIVCQEVLKSHEAFGSLALIQSSSLLRCIDVNDPTVTPHLLQAPLSLNLPNLPELPIESGVPRVHRSGLYVSSCGHRMHLSCFSTYAQSIESRHASQPTRNHPEDLGRREFVCPLCKTLGNVLLPHASQTSTTVPVYVDAGESKAVDQLEDWCQATTAGQLNRPEVLQSFTRADGGQLRAFKIEEELAFLRRNAPLFESNGQSADHVMLKRIMQVCWPLSIEAHREAIQSIEIHSVYLPSELVAYTVAAVEVQQRGKDVGATQDDSNERACAVIKSLFLCLRQISTLACRNGIKPEDLAALEVARLTSMHPKQSPYLGIPILQRDPLELLIELTALAPEAIYHFLTLTFYLEISKALISSHRMGASSVDNLHLLPSRSADGVGIFATEVLAEVKRSRGGDLLLSDRNEVHCGKLICTLVLPFLRRASLILKATVGTTSVTATQQETSQNEFDRLLQQLRIPHPASINNTKTLEMTTFFARVVGWLTSFYANPSASKVVQSWLVENPLSHGLIHLPDNLDVLVERAARFTCQNCGNSPPEAAMCLLCGQIVCNQSFCCMDRDVEDVPRLGECNSHMLR